MKDESTGDGISRRELLAGAGKFSLGGLALASVGGLGALAGCTESNDKTTSSGINGAELPWPYKSFNTADIKRVQETAHENWFTGFCAFATFSSIVSILREKVGEPYTSFPMEAITFGHGGTAGWGGTCGTLTGAGLAASLAAGPQSGEQILNDVIKWYTDTQLPIYQPDQPRVQIKTVSKSDSPLCHVSVGKWMAKEGVGFQSPQQMERCARLSSDVAARTVTHLNQRLDNSFSATAASPVTVNGMPSQNNCTECHGTNIPTVPARGGGESLIGNG